MAAPTKPQNAREAILARIRAHLAKPIADHNLEPARPSRAPAHSLPPEGMTDAERFVAALEAVGGHAHRAADADEARRILLEFIAARGIRRVVLVDAPILQRIGIPTALQEANLETTIISARGDTAADISPEARANLLAVETAADLCVSGADYAIAETGTIVLAARRGLPRAATMLAPVHIAFVHESQIVPHLEALIPRLQADLLAEGVHWRTSYLMLTTGPSRTADIEQTLTIGVHGPGDMGVILLQDQTAEE